MALNQRHTPQLGIQDLSDLQQLLKIYTIPHIYPHKHHMIQFPVSSSNFSLHLALPMHTTQSTQILPILQGLCQSLLPQRNLSPSPQLHVIFYFPEPNTFLLALLWPAFYSTYLSPLPQSPFNRYLLGLISVPGTVLGTRSTGLNKTSMTPQTAQRSLNFSVLLWNLHSVPHDKQQEQLFYQGARTWFINILLYN